jgi:hypothetical protein
MGNEISDSELEMIYTAHDVNLEFMPEVNAEEARRYAENDLEDFGKTAIDGTVSKESRQMELQMKLGFMKDYAEANPHYKAVIVERGFPLEKLLYGENIVESAPDPEKNITGSVKLTEDQRKQVLDEVKEEFVPMGENGRQYVYRFSGEVAFHDDGNKLYTRKTDANIAVAMMKVAEAKGWKSIKVNGHPDFKREVWMEASLKGIAVKGFSPSDKDLAALEERRQKMAAKTTTTAPKIPVSAVKTENPKVFEGTLLEHGRAPYQHDEKNQSSYYVKVRDDAGNERTAWGVDLKRAIDKAGVVEGDKVRLENEGNKVVSVKTPIMGKDGKVTGHEEKEVKRNSWNVEKTQGQEVTEALAKSLLLKNGLNPESPAARQFLEAVSAETTKREAAGKLPKVPIRDAKADVKKREADKTKLRPRRRIKQEKEISQEQTR